MNRSAARSIDQYLRQLREELAGSDSALIQDALYDAEEYLRAEVAAHPGKSEADVRLMVRPMKWPALTATRRSR
jgi:uncharacterized membrane protein